MSWETNEQQRVPTHAPVLIAKSARRFFAVGAGWLAAHLRAVRAVAVAVADATNRH